MAASNYPEVSEISGTIHKSTHTHMHTLRLCIPAYRVTAGASRGFETHNSQVLFKMYIAKANYVLRKVIKVLQRKVDAKTRKKIVLLKSKKDRVQQMIDDGMVCRFGRSIHGV